MLVANQLLVFIAVLSVFIATAMIADSIQYRHLNFLNDQVAVMVLYCNDQHCVVTVSDRCDCKE